jgi:hypothetical protein
MDHDQEQQIQAAEPDPLAGINVDLLPPNLRRLVRVLGNKLAFALCKARGGTPIRVPQRASVEHWLHELVGHRGMSQLVEAWGGEYLDVPKLDKVMMQWQHQEVHALLRNGLGATEVALRTGYTKRHVLNIQADLQRAEGVRYMPPQGDLFAELLVPSSSADSEHDLDAMEEAAVAEQEAAHRSQPVRSIDDEHRETAKRLQHAANNPFGIGNRSR